jgi:2'-5' RNA ligase
VGESALIVAVPEAEPLVGRFRERYDTSAAVGVPAHVTLLYPFLPPEAIGPSDLAALTTLFASARPFDLVFRRCARFEPKVLWLAPEPDAPLRDLMRRLFARWPECPPYAGTIAPDAVTPHLTVSDSIVGDHLDRLDLAVAGGLPIAARVTAALLIENRVDGAFRDGRWTTREQFALGR